MSVSQINHIGSPVLSERENSVLLELEKQVAQIWGNFASGNVENELDMAELELV